MKNILAAFLLTVLATLGAYSFWSGMRAEQEFNDFVHGLATDADVRVLSSEFRRGWAHSRGEIELEVHGETGAGFASAVGALGGEEVRARLGLRMRHEVKHGHDPLIDWLTGGMDGTPVIARVHSWVDFDNETQAELAAVLGRLPGLEIDTVVFASGRGESQVRMRAVRLQKQDKEHALRANWRGLAGTMVWKDGFSGVSGRFQAAGLDGRGERIGLEISGIELSFETEPGAEFLLGDAQASIAGLHVREATTGADYFALEGLDVAQRSRVEAGAYGADVALALDVVRIEQDGYGPGVLELSVSGLDAAALTQIQRTGSRLQSAKTAPEISEEARAAALAGEISALLPALFSRAPSVEMKTLELATPDGDLRASAKASMGDGVGATANPLLLMSAVSAEFAAEIPAPLFERMVESQLRAALSEGQEEAEINEQELAALRDERIAELRSSGYVVFSEGVYRARLLLRGGQLTVNGIPFQGLKTTASDAAEPDISMLGIR